MDKLRAIEIFIRLADLGSFTAVAEEQGASKSTISKEISRLENELGTRLFHRSTRNIQLTLVGQGYLERCRKIVSDVGAAEAFAQAQHLAPKGTLKVAVPMALGITDLSRMFSEFMLSYPDIELDIDLNDESQDLIQKGFDIGLRAASTQFDSSYVGKPLTTFKYKVVAAPSYLDSHPPITTPADLSNHSCFVYSYFRGKATWPFGQGIPISGPLRVNNTIFMLEFVKRGIGVGFMPEFVCKSAIMDGHVKSILDEYNTTFLTLYAIYPARHYMPITLIRCIEFMEDWFKHR